MSAEIHKETANASLSRQRFGFRTRQVEDFVLITTTSTLVAPNNPDRIHLTIVSNSIQPIYLSKAPDGAAPFGVPLAMEDSVVSWDSDLDGEATGYERWGIVSAGSGYVLVVQTIRLREREG